MELLGYIIGLFVGGLIIGAIARLILPGRQRIGVLRTILAGIGGSVIGGLIFWAVDKNAEDHTVVGFAIAVGCAVLIVAVLSSGRSDD